MIVSVHIPKTAGTSLRVGLERRLGRRLLLDYEDRPLARTEEDLARRARSAAAVRADPRSLLSDYDAVHGHFIASKYLPLGAEARFAVFLREPVARTLSHFRHWRRNPEAPNPVARRISAGEIGPADLAEMIEYRTIYTTFIGGLQLEQFSFVGLAEHYPASIALFQAIFGIELPALHQNPSPEADALDMPAHELQRVKAAQTENAVVYDRARRRFDELCAAHL